MSGKHGKKTDPRIKVRCHRQNRRRKREHSTAGQSLLEAPLHEDGKLFLRISGGNKTRGEIASYRLKDKSPGAHGRAAPQA